MSFDELRKLLSALSPGMRSLVERLMETIPPVRARLDREVEKILSDNEDHLLRRSAFPISFSRLPEMGLPRETIAAEMEGLCSREAKGWRAGGASGAVYIGDDELADFLNRVYASQSQSNPLHADIWPSTAKFEAEIVAMTGSMLNGTATESGKAYGTVTSGGTESILLAVKTARDQARITRGVRRPQMVVPATAHAAFGKAAELFGIKIVYVPVDSDYRCDVRGARRAINRNTVLVVGSAPSFPHGVVDPIEELSELARKNGINFHTDACLGGFVLPWARRLGYVVPPFDFALPGVTSISADTHKYGYAPKGNSVVLYRSAELRRHQYFTFSDWPGGLYFSPTLAGSRPGGLSAACWAALVSQGEDGYLTATKQILETAAVIRDGINKIAGLKVLGEPLWVIAFGSDSLDIYRVLDAMSERGWTLNGLQRPPALHICVTLRHTAFGVADAFLDDLRSAVKQVRSEPARGEGMAPIYGMAAAMPLRGPVRRLLARYIDLLYKT